MGIGENTDRRKATREATYRRPFLKWAGNKFGVLSHIQPLLAQVENKTRLVEPFVGSGAVFLNMPYDQYLLCDINSDLIVLYQTLQAQGETFIEYCRQFFVPENNCAEAFYPLRDQFNSSTDPVLKSALFIYLNRHGYNGLCRYNGKGGFNVPFGRYKAPYFPAAEMAYFHRKSQQARFVCQDFEALTPELTPQDVVYCDPPYVPLSRTANFTSYSNQQFGLSQQAQLAQWADQLCEQGITVLISNHATEFTRQAYANARQVEFDVQRFISANGARRGKARELLALFPASVSV